MKPTTILVGLVGLVSLTAAAPAASNNGDEALDTPFRAVKVKRFGTCYALCAFGYLAWNGLYEDYKEHGCHKSFFQNCSGEGEEVPKPE